MGRDGIGMAEGGEMTVQQPEVSEHPVLNQEEMRNSRIGIGSREARRPKEEGRSYEHSGDQLNPAVRHLDKSQMLTEVSTSLLPRIRVDCSELVEGKI